MLAGLFLLMVISSCEKKKYPEDERKSWHSTCWRIKGKWKIEKITFNGDDVTNTYNDTLAPYVYNDIVFDFRINEDLGRGGKKDWVFITTVNENKIGNMNFGIDIKNSMIGIRKADDYENIEDPIIFGKMSNLFATLWEIKKLYNKEMHLKSLKTNYDFYFKQ